MKTDRAAEEERQELTECSGGTLSVTEVAHRSAHTDAEHTEHSDTVTTRAQEGDNSARGMLLVGGSALCFSVMSLLVKALSNAGIPSFQIVFFNACIRVLVALPQLALSLRSVGWPIRDLYTATLVLLRSCGGLCGIACAFYAFGVLPLGDATVVLFTAPVWTSLLAAIVLQEKLTTFDCASTGLSLTGVAMVAQPKFLVRGTQGDMNNADAVEDSTRMMGTLVALCGAIASAIAYCSVRKLGRAVPPVMLVTSFSLLTACVSPPLLVLFEQDWTRVSSVRLWVFLFLMGMVGYLGQILLNTGPNPITTLTLTLINPCSSQVFSLGRLVESHWHGTLTLCLPLSSS